MDFLVLLKYSSFIAIDELKKQIWNYHSSFCVPLGETGGNYMT